MLFQGPYTMSLMKNKIFRILLILGILFLNIGADQLTKHLALEYLSPGKTVQVVGDIFVLRLAYNTGAFLSFGAGFDDLFKALFFRYGPLLILTVLFVYLLFSYAWKKQLKTSYVIALSTILGGGFGNLIDRFVNDSTVLDFMNFGIGSLRTGILNVADLSITFGALALIILLLLQEKKKNNKDSKTLQHNNE